ncbi:kinase-like domain-containing protein, partial [Mycena olivaceomarginata]
ICRALWRLSRDTGLHPRCFALTGLQKIGQQVVGGGFSDIWKGLVQGQTVYVKMMLVIWHQFCHPNLLPFFGLYYLENRLCLVSPWMENGNIMEFLRFDRRHSIRLSLILDVALGLKYLHEINIVHGDLKGVSAVQQ